MKPLERWISLGLVLTLGFLLGMLGFSVWDKMPSPLEPVAWSTEAQWIAPPEPSYRFYARKTFYISDTVQAGWLRLSADNDFVFHINGRQSVVRENGALNSPQGLAYRRKVPFQDANDSIRYNANTGLNYLFASSRDWKLTVYVDLTSYLRPGKNVIALEIQKGQKNARLAVEGVVYPDGKSSQIYLTTGATPWRVSTLPENRQSLRWFHPGFSDESWPYAVTIGPVREATYSRLSQHIFDHRLQGSWIAGTESSQGEVWLRSSWRVPQERKRAFIRLAGEGEYALLINGQLVKRYSEYFGKKLHVFEVTNFLQTGVNTLAVRLARPLDPDLLSAHKDPLGFFLDGWVETNEGKITAAIATDNTWTTLTQPIAGWAEGSGEGQSVTLLRPLNPQELQRNFEGNAYLLNYPEQLWHQSLWYTGGIVCALILAWILGRFWLNRWDGWWDGFSAGAGLLLPGTLFLICIGLLKHRYAEAEIGLLFAQPHTNSLILLGFAIIVLLTLLWNQIGQSSETLSLWSLWFFLGLFACIGLGLAVGVSVLLILLVLGIILTLTLLGLRRCWQVREGYIALRKAWPAWGHWVLLVLIVGIGFGLRAYKLGFIDLDSDENVSYDAVRGILRTGAPIATSGIWYTRGPFYHYLLALWLWIVGDSAVNARFLSVLWGTATLVLVYFFAHRVTGKVWIALVVTAILAIDPWHLWYSRFLRFYQLVQFMTILTFWSFLKGFVEGAGRFYQYIFFIALTLTLLTQEVTVTLLPGLFIGFLYFYRPFKLSNDWPIVLGSMTTLGIFAYNIIFFSIKCLTPWVALSTSTASYLKPHLLNVTGFVASFFVGPGRLQILYSLFFFGGLVFFLRRRDGKSVFLFSSVLINIIVLTILTYQTAERYAYSVYPLFILLSVYSAICIMQSLGERVQSVLDGVLPVRAIALCCLALLLVSNIQPARVLAGYQHSIARRNTEIFEYIRTHKQPGDVVISPTPSFGPINLGRVDYFLLGTFYFDATYWHDGRLIDRWGGGVIVSNLDQIKRILEKSERVWIHVDDARQSRLSAQMLEYIQTLGKPVYDTFGASLRLWQPEDGILPHSPNQGKDLGAY
ncbi:MAG: glycosyltransferase family 39 protein [Xenococcaceae cyanobacterium]